MNKLNLHNVAKPMVQPKLAVNKPGDRYEQEADAMAERVVAGAARSGFGATPGTAPQPGGGMIAKSIQRKCAHCEEEEKKKVRRKDDGSGLEVSSDIASRLDRTRGGGTALPQQTRDFMEGAFSADFSRVRIHANGEANAMSRDIHAKAFTHGRDIYFDRGQYAPESSSGQRLLAHELTHVVQQQGGATGIQRDLATLPPAKKQKKKPNLTKGQIDAAIAYNHRRFQEWNTRLIQQLLGGPVTGEWTVANIVAIANTQEEYGLDKTGKIDQETFEFLDREQQLEKKPVDQKNCLVSFTVLGPPEQEFGVDDGDRPMVSNHFTIEAAFSKRCDCHNFEYRQFIKGFVHRTRNGKREDIPSKTRPRPGGILTNDWAEDGNLSNKGRTHVGYRNEPGIGREEYTDENGNRDQKNGCNFEYQDIPAESFDARPGDRFDILKHFRGEIRNGGHVVQQRVWTAIDVQNWRPMGDSSNLHRKSHGGAGGVAGGGTDDTGDGAKPAAVSRLSRPEIFQAMSFNAQRLQPADAKRILTILNLPTSADHLDETAVQAIADIQATAQLPVTGKIDSQTFAILANRQQLSSPRDLKDCLVAFRIGDIEKPHSGFNGPAFYFQGGFTISAEFSQQCNCRNFLYRQNVKGKYVRHRWGQPDLNLPTHSTSKTVPPTFTEDDDTTDPKTPHYGHRDEPGQTAGGSQQAPDNRYMDNGGNTDQVDGCTYIGTDQPALTDPHFQPNDTYDAQFIVQGQIVDAKGHVILTLPDKTIFDKQNVGPTASQLTLWKRANAGTP